MPTIAEKLQQIAAIKANIKAAIEAKGETVGSDAFSTYPTHIENISGGGGGGSDLDDFVKNTLETLTIPSGVTKVRDYLCYGQNFLKYVTIPSGVTAIGVAAFQNCTGLTSITIPSGVTAIPNDMCNGAQNIASITLPAGILTFGSNSFKSVKYITGFTFPDSTTTLGNYMFDGCSRLQRIVYPPLVKTIATQINYNNTALQYIEIGAQVTAINNNAFNGCKAVTTIVCRATTPPTVQAATFGNGTSNYTGRTTYNSGVNKLYVPQGCSSAYNTSYWASVLLDSTKCGFTIAELDANGNIPT